MPRPPAGIQVLRRRRASTQLGETCVPRSLLAPRERQLPSNSNGGGAGALCGGQHGVEKGVCGACRAGMTGNLHESTPLRSFSELNGSHSMVGCPIFVRSRSGHLNLTAFASPRRLASLIHCTSCNGWLETRLLPLSYKRDLRFSAREQLRRRS